MYLFVEDQIGATYVVCLRCCNIRAALIGTVSQSASGRSVVEPTAENVFGVYGMYGWTLYTSCGHAYVIGHVVLCRLRLMKLRREVLGGWWDGGREEWRHGVVTYGSISGGDCIRHGFGQEFY